MRVKIRSMGPMRRVPGRHEAADVGEQGDQRGLAHVGRFAAHVRAGDDEHAPAIRQAKVVGHERIFQDLLDHRMTTLPNLRCPAVR